MTKLERILKAIVIWGLIAWALVWLTLKFLMTIEDFVKYY